MKTCFKCKAVRPLTEFYKHAAMSDGYLNKCKECAKKDSLNHRNQNLEKIRANDRERGKSPERKKLKALINKRWRDEDTRRQKAHNAVRRAIVSGALERKCCERCGNEKSLAHHEDYDKQLEVMWLCQPCHKQRHKELKEEF